jgi:hypothetical protein
MKYPEDGTDKAGLYPLAAAVADTCQWDLALNRGRLFRVAKALKAVGATPEDVQARFGKGSWWYRVDWRGRQYGQAPTPEQVLNHWKSAAPKPVIDRATAARAALPREEE